MVYWYAAESTAVFQWQTEAILASRGNSITLLLTEMPLGLLKYLNGKYVRFSFHGRWQHLIVYSIIPETSATSQWLTEPVRCPEMMELPYWLLRCRSVFCHASVAGRIRSVAISAYY
jgi:hypothetical protein